MSEIFFASSYCKSKSNCFECRHNRQFRADLYKKGDVNTPDFKCLPFGFPIGAPMGSLPHSTRRRAKSKQGKNKVAAVTQPQIIRATSLLRRHICEGEKASEEELLEAYNTLEVALFPKGVPPVCRYMEMTNHQVRAGGCKCKGKVYVVICQNPENETTGQQLTTVNCNRKRCRFFAE